MGIKKLYTVIEKCGKHGLQIVRKFTSYLDAIQALKKIAIKYAKNIGYYRNFGFTASISNRRFLLESVAAK